MQLSFEDYHRVRLSLAPEWCQCHISGPRGLVPEFFFPTGFNEDRIRIVPDEGRGRKWTVCALKYLAYEKFGDWEIIKIVVTVFVTQLFATMETGHLQPSVEFLPSYVGSRLELNPLYLSRY